jgi:adenosine kinase
MAVTSNDYELELICSMTGLDLKGVLELTPVVITTLGEKGSRIQKRDGSQSEIKAAHINRLEDPTGAGDSYRAGLIKGIISGMSLEDSACLASVCASFCVEHYGTQEHYYDETSLEQRFQATYGLKIPIRINPLIKNGA